MRLALLLAAGCGVTSIDVKAPAPAADVAAPFTLTKQDGTAFSPSGDVVLVFYRGHW
jgi:hypothetical protein